MLTSEDIQKLMAVLATKEDVREVREDLEGLRETVHELTIAIDRLAKAVDDLHIEYAAIAMQTTRHEKWIQQIADKLGIKLAY